MSERQVLENRYLEAAMRRLSQAWCEHQDSFSRFLDEPNERTKDEVDTKAAAVRMAEGAFYSIRERVEDHERMVALLQYQIEDLEEDAAFAEYPDDPDHHPVPDEDVMEDAARDPYYPTLLSEPEDYHPEFEFFPYDDPDYETEITSVMPEDPEEEKYPALVF